MTAALRWKREGGAFASLARRAGSISTTCCWAERLACGGLGMTTEAENLIAKIIDAAEEMPRSRRHSSGAAKSRGC